MAFEFDKSVLAKLQDRARKSVRAGGITLQNEVKKVLSEGGASNLGNGAQSQSSAGGPPSVRTGTLRRSIQTDETDLDGKFTVRVGTNVVYARIQEFGGRIVAKGGGLPIPIGSNAAEAYRVRRQAGGSLRNAKLTPVKTRSGNLLLVKESGKRSKNKGAWTPLFVVKKSVRLPARPYFRPALARSKQAVAAAMANQFRGGAA